MSNLIKGEKKSLKQYLLLNCKYSYHTVQSDQSKLLFTMYLFFIDIVGEIGKKIYSYKLSKQVFSCLHPNIWKRLFLPQTYLLVRKLLFLFFI